jgi:GT2 family glycosyltransferase/glycosyltransferase involved in cell wall biosynthesis
MPGTWSNHGKMLAYLRRLILLALTLLASPILMLLSATLLFFNLVHLLTRFTRQRMPAEGPPLSGLATIIILNWNGRELLAQCLPSVIEAVRVDGRPHEILVVDNGSTDGSVELVKKDFPHIRLLELPENLGFAEGNNAGVAAAHHDIVVLLNNDMVVDSGFLRPLLDGFGPTTFAVSSQIFFQDPDARREETGKTTARFRRGMIDYSHCPVESEIMRRAVYPVFWAGGGSSAFHRGRFLSLGGFQDVFSPAYVEDTDLSYQAWKIGWEVLFAPASVVYHRHRASSTQRFTPLELQTLIQRNQLIFIWKNIRSWRLLFSHCLNLPWNCYRLARDYGLAIWSSFIQATLSMASVQIARLGVPFRGVRTDQEIFSLMEKPGLFSPRRTEAARRHLPDDGGERRPRVLWMTAYLPHLGRHAGAGRMFHLLRRMSRSYRVTLLSFLETDDEVEFLPELERICERVVTMRRHPPQRWHLFPYEPFDEFRTPEMEAAVRESLENYDYSLVQLEYTQMASYAENAAGIPVVLTKHEIDFAACLRRAKLETRIWSKLRWFYNYLQVLDREIRLQRGIAASVCMTDSDAGMLRRFCASSPIRVINTGVDLDYFTPPAQPALEPHMVFVGAFQHLPNVEAMIYFCREIFPLIRKQVREASLAIVGSKPSPEIVDLAEIPGIEVTGYVPDIRPHMAAASVYVVPLRLGVGIRGKILEAWSMALPVVATSIACSGLRYKSGKNLLLADTAQDFAENVVMLLRDPRLRARLGAAGRQTAENHYGWDAAAQQLESLYREMSEIGGRGSRAAEPMGVATEP